jgi:hypothetical protein
MAEEEPKPLNYRTPTPRGRGSVIVAAVGITIYASGLCVCSRFDNVFGAMYAWTWMVVFLTAVVAGIKYGTQDKEYWL